MVIVSESCMSGAKQSHGVPRRMYLHVSLVENAACWLDGPFCPVLKETDGASLFLFLVTF